MHDVVFLNIYHNVPVDLMVVVRVSNQIIHMLYVPVIWCNVFVQLVVSFCFIFFRSIRLWPMFALAPSPSKSQTYIYYSVQLTRLSHMWNMNASNVWIISVCSSSYAMPSKNSVDSAQTSTRLVCCVLRTYSAHKWKGRKEKRNTLQCSRCTHADEK